MSTMTVNSAARASGWSARMLRYIEELGLLSPRRTAGGYRLYEPDDVRRLGELRELRTRYRIDLAGLALVARLRRDPPARAAVDGWLDGAAPAAPAAWLDYEQRKHAQLLRAA